MVLEKIPTHTLLRTTPPQTQHAPPADVSTRLNTPTFRHLVPRLSYPPCSSSHSNNHGIGTALQINLPPMTSVRPSAGDGPSKTHERSVPFSHNQPPKKVPRWSAPVSTQVVPSAAHPKFSTSFSFVPRRNVHVHYFKFPTGATYNGTVKNRIPHGLGELTYSDNSKYVGGFKDGQRHGKGTFTWLNGNHYMGDFHEGLYHGKGKFTFANGNHYEGDFRKKLPHGKGKLVFVDNRVYEGDVRFGYPTGKGTLTLANGTTCEGNFHFGYPTGICKLTLANGDTCERHFPNTQVATKVHLI